MTSQLLNQVEIFATELLKYRISTKLYFHNLTHTHEVVAATIDIANHSNLTKEELETVTIAAWFHDIGYCDLYKGHEQRSADMASVFLSSLVVDALRIKQIISCILATKMPQKPLSLLEEIICDVDFYHFSRSDYPEHAVALRKEWQINLNLQYSEKQWQLLNLKMLTEHTYWTSYGKTVLQLRKEENLKQLNTDI